MPNRLTYTAMSLSVFVFTLIAIYLAFNGGDWRALAACALAPLGTAIILYADDAL